jgi:Dyp-type peroxidase family
LGDPVEGEGSPGTWVVGSEDNEADLVLIFGADDRDDLFAEVSRIEDSIFSARTPDGQPLRCGVRIIHKQHGAVLPPPLTGHEHFGFLDGVSQPGIRGRVSEEEWDVLTPRQNPDDPEQGKPGQDLLWPGEFVFGYPGQDPNATEEDGGIHKKGPNSLFPKGPDNPVAPKWAQDGAYLVFRRLRQDVPGFRGFVCEEAGNLGIANPDLLGAKLVGRWKSGAPIMRTPDQDDPELAGNDCANNDFEFASDQEEAPEAAAPRGPADCLCERLPEVEPDDEGLKCPFAGHIRKAYPRNDQPPGEVETQTHRLLRRGIPFGPPFPIDPPPHHMDSGDRGLLFLAYQTSIEEQFEFVQKVWCNNPDFKDRDAGHDLIIGQNPDGDRFFTLNLEGDRKTLRTDKQWVIPTGGGYFFAPSIYALELLASGKLG